MAVQVAGSLIFGDRTGHQARSVGQGGWVVSYLPGRTLGSEQAVAAIQLAESVAELSLWAQAICLTPLEAVGQALLTPASPIIGPPERDRRDGRGRL